MNGSGAISGSGAIGGAELTGSDAGGSASGDVDDSVASGTASERSAAGDPDSVGSVLLISIEGLESEDAGLIGSVAMASAALCKKRKLKGVVTCRFEDAANADVLTPPSRDKLI